MFACDSVNKISQKVLIQRISFLVDDFPLVRRWSDSIFLFAKVFFLVLLSVAINTSEFICSFLLISRRYQLDDDRHILLHDFMSYMLQNTSDRAQAL